MDKSDLWLMKDNFYKSGYKKKNQNIKTACKPLIFIKTDPNQVN